MHKQAGLLAATAEYHNFRVFGKNAIEIRALMADVEQYYVQVDAFNENGITEGKTCVV